MSSNRPAPLSATILPRASLFLSLTVGLALSGIGCGRNTLIGIDTIDVPPGSGGSTVFGTGGSSPPGGTGGISGGVTGTGGFSLPVGGTGACSTISTAEWTQNDCGRVTDVAYSPDGTLLAAVTEDQEPFLRVWRLADGQLLLQPPQADHPQGALGVSFSPDGKLIATAGFAPDTVAADGTTSQSKTDTVKIWNAATGALVVTLPTNCDFYASAAEFSHDGKYLATAGALGNIEIWSVADWTRVMSIPDTVATIYALHYSPDDRRLLASDGGTNTIFDTSTGSLMATIPNLVNEMNEASYSPNGQLIFASGAEGQIQILDSTAMTLQTMTFSMGGSPPYIGCGRWIGNDHVVAGDWSGTVEEWSKDPSQTQGPFSITRTWTMPGQPLGISVAPDGQSFVVSGSFGFVFLKSY